MDMNYLNLIFEYKNGRLIWKERGADSLIGEITPKRLGRLKSLNKKLIGEFADKVIDKDGYRKVKLNNRQYKAHRIVYMMHFNALPMDLEIDHVNGDRSDNRIENLRVVSHMKNMQNKSLQSNNKSGFHGIRFHRCSGKYCASIKVAGKAIHLGLFASKDDALNARKLAEIKYGFHGNHGRPLAYLPKVSVKAGWRPTEEE